MRQRYARSLLLRALLTAALPLLPAFAVLVIAALLGRALALAGLI